MKKAWTVFTALVLLAGLAACSAKPAQEPAPSTIPAESTTDEATVTGATGSIELITTQATATGATTTAVSTFPIVLPVTTTAAAGAATAAAGATTAAGEKSTNAPGSAYVYTYPGISPAVAKVPADPYLICVNRSYALPANYTPALRVCVEAYEQKIQMETTAAKQYKAMYDAAKAAGAEIIPYSGYRSIARQKNNFDRLIQTNVDRGHSYAEAVNLAAQVILPPGSSEHNAGLAMDITRPGYWDTRDDFEDTKEYAWLQAHAHEYGFVLRYPKDKVDITLVQFEPWHWRYVGAEDATAMKHGGQCLEEYLGVN